VNFFCRISFDLWYCRRPPWDTNIVPPEVEIFIRDHPPGRLLDLGCGTGTSSLAFASRGWAVTGVDFSWRAIRHAKKKARLKNLLIDFRVADVTHLPNALLTNANDLVLDVGCFHGLSPSGQAAYLVQLMRLLAPSATLLLYGFFKPDESPVSGLIQTSLDLNNLKLIKRQDGLERNIRPSAWFWYQKEQQ
jgi:SAM-dependent methyltransferase